MLAQLDQQGPATGGARNAGQDHHWVDDADLEGAAGFEGWLEDFAADGDGGDLGFLPAFAGLRVDEREAPADAGFGEGVAEHVHEAALGDEPGEQHDVAPVPEFG